MSRVTYHESQHTYFGHDRNLRMLARYSISKPNSALRRFYAASKNPNQGIIDLLQRGK